MRGGKEEEKERESRGIKDGMTYMYFLSRLATNTVLLHCELLNCQIIAVPSHEPVAKQLVKKRREEEEERYKEKREK